MSGAEKHAADEEDEVEGELVVRSEAGSSSGPCRRAAEGAMTSAPTAAIPEVDPNKPATTSPTPIAMAAEAMPATAQVSLDPIARSPVQLQAMTRELSTFAARLA